MCISLEKCDPWNAGVLLFKFKPKVSVEPATATCNLTGRVPSVPDFPLKGAAPPGAAAIREAEAAQTQHRGLESEGWAPRRLSF